MERSSLTEKIELIISQRKGKAKDRVGLMRVCIYLIDQFSRIYLHQNFVHWKRKFYQILLERDSMGTDVMMPL